MSNKKPIGWPQAIRDVLIASINKGQLPVLFFGLILLLIVYKMPSEVAGQLAIKIVQDLEDWYLAGYAGFGIVVVGWTLHAKSLNRQIVRLLERK